MSNIYKNVIELIGKTPLVEVENVEKRFKLQARLLVKLDGYNPAGSAKDRIAYQMIVDAEETGKLKEGSVRTNIRKYRDRTCSDRCIQRIQGNPHNARDNEC